MTDESNTALLYSILPAVQHISKSDPETSRKLNEIFIKVEKHAPGFSADFVASIYKGKNLYWKHDKNLSDY